jgi:hypothetical protein
LTTHRSVPGEQDPEEILSYSPGDPLPVELVEDIIRH